MADSSIEMNTAILPVVKGKERIQNAIFENDVLIIIGEPGCGKTTKIPLYVQKIMLKFNRSEPNLCCCTQPRRIAALRAAEKVSKDLNCELGQEVGYHVRFDNRTSDKTIICYMTDGILIKELHNDRNLSKYTSVILDEVHERSIHNDLLLTLLKSICISRNKNYPRKFKLIIMSATFDVCKFSNYFNDCKIVCIGGRQHSIDILYTEKPQPSYIHSAVVTAMKIHLNDNKSNDLGTILIFLTGEEEIETVAYKLKCLNNSMSKHDPSFKKLIICTLYANLSRDIQNESFTAPVANCRKIIIATNIAETSVTIPGIKFIIDSGKVKRKKYDPHMGLESLTVCQISKEQADQRAGRAGREQSGVCYRLYTEKEWDEMEQYTERDLAHSDLTSIILEMFAIGIKNIFNFNFFEDPNPLLIKRGINNLLMLDCITKVDHENDRGYELNSTGRNMSLFPLDPFHSKLIINSIKYSCVKEMLIMVSVLSLEEFLHIPLNTRDRIFKMLNTFNRGAGDHILYLDISTGWMNNRFDKGYGKRYFINWKNSEMFRKIHEQVSSIFLTNLKLEISSSTDIEEFQKCLLSVLYINICEHIDKGQYHSYFYNLKLYIHPSSSYFHEKPEFVIFSKLVHTTKPYMKMVTPVKREWIEPYQTRIKEYQIKSIFNLDKL